MKKRVALLSIFMVFIIFALGIAAADILNYKSGNSLQKSYKAGEIIKGKLNLSISDELAESILTSNFEGNITLLDLIKANNFIEGPDFECNVVGCTPKYSPEASITEIDLNGEKIVGLKLKGNSISEITSFKLNINSNLQEACNTPLLIDLFADNKEQISSTSYNDNACTTKNNGCFGIDLDSDKYSKVIIEDFDQEMCETIIVGPAPAYRIGARITDSIKKGKLEMTLYDSEGYSFSCILPNQTKSEEDLSCIVNKSSIQQTNFTICVSSLDYCSDENTCPDYQIRSESTSPICGSSTRDFELFTIPLEFKQDATNITEDSFDKLYPDSDPLYDSMFNYLLENYPLNGENTVQCDPCVIPIKITGANQKLQVNNIDFKFRNGGLITNDESFKKLYELESIPVKMNSRPLSISLDPAKFTIPLSSNETKLKLYLNKELFFQDNISIEKSFYFDINTNFAFLGLQTRFDAVTSFNITSSKWDFGDNTPVQESTGKSIYHTYTESNTYTLKVTLMRKDGISAVKEFQIVVGNPKESAPKTIQIYKERISKLSVKINSFPQNTKNSLQTLINITALNASLSLIEQEYLKASSDDEYTEVMNKLLDLNIPTDIISSMKGKLPLAVGFKNINPEYVEEISEEQAPSGTTNLEEIIIGWFNEHYTSEIQFDNIAEYTDKGKEALLTQFTLSISPKEGKESPAYLFFNYPFESIIFQKDYGQKPLGEKEAAYIPIKAEQQDIEFFIKDNIEAADLGAFISPKISELGIEQNITKICAPDDPTCKVPFPTSKLILWLSIALVLILIIYIILQEWYKKHYEHSLFKNPNDLYNLVNFIYNSRVSGLADREIRQKLKDTGWKNEKITYAFKKIDGKRTGMWEIPIFKPFENRRVRAEIEKRQQAPIDVRFIKQPRF